MPTLLWADDFARPDSLPGDADPLGNGWAATSGGGNSLYLSGGVVSYAAGSYSNAQRPYYKAANLRAVRLVVRLPNWSWSGNTALTGALPTVYCRFDPATRTGYGVLCWKTYPYIAAVKCTNGLADTQLVGINGPAEASQDYLLQLDVTDGPGAGVTTLKVDLFRASAPTVSIATASVTDSEALLQRFGDVAIGGDGYNGPQAVIDRLEVWDLTSTVPDAGSLASGAVDGTSHNVANAVAPSGGTAPLAQSWYRARTLSFTPGPSSLVAGQTGTTLSVPAPDGEIWYYVRRATGADAQFADTSPVKAVRGYPTYRVVQIGDSITETAGAYDLATPVQQALEGTGPRTVQIVNAGKAGAYLANLPAGRDPYYVIQPSLPGSFYFQAAAGVVDKIAANNCTVASIRLGMNDSAGYSTAAADYGAALDALIADLVNVRGIRTVIVHAPTYAHFAASSDTSGRVATLESYRSAILARVDNVTVFAGDFDAWYYLALHPELYTDGVHMASAADLARFEAVGLARAFDRIEGRAGSAGRTASRQLARSR